MKKKVNMFGNFFTRNYYATCLHCGHQHRVSFWKWFFAPNAYSLWVWAFESWYFRRPYRWLRCPSCKKHFWTELEPEAQVRLNELVRDANEALMEIPKYISEHHDEIVEELNKEGGHL